MQSRGQRIERVLAGYFGASAVTRQVPLLGETVRSLQEMTARNADAVTRDVLFPALSGERRRALIDVLHGRTVGAAASTEAQTDSGDREPTTSSSSSSPALLASARAAVIRGTSREAHTFRLLTNRFSSALDGDKSFGFGEEVTYDELRRDVNDIWTHAQLAVQSLKTHQQAHQLGTTSPPLPRHLVFVVAYSHTHGARGVGARLCSIQSRAQALVHNQSHRRHLSREHASPASGLASILRVVPITVGIQLRPWSRTTSSRTPADGAAPISELHYPHGGFYTLNALLHVTQSLPTTTLRHHTLILSEGWLHPRTMALLHQRPQARSTVEVVPGVVSDALSERETEAFARYVVSQLRRL